MRPLQDLILHYNGKCPFKNTLGWKGWKQTVEMEERTDTEGSRQSLVPQQGHHLSLGSINLPYGTSWKTEQLGKRRSQGQRVEVVVTGQHVYRMEREWRRGTEP